MISGIQIVFSINRFIFECEILRLARVWQVIAENISPVIDPHFWQRLSKYWRRRWNIIIYTERDNTGSKNITINSSDFEK